jgi:Domain of unknown function (DUF4365)
MSDTTPNLTGIRTSQGFTPVGFPDEQRRWERNRAGADDWSTASCSLLQYVQKFLPTILLPEQTIEELLSLAHLQAIAARAGISIAMNDRDFGVDGTFRPLVKRGNRIFPNGYALDFQLKASTKYRSESNFIIYDLEAKTYNDLVQRRQSGDFIPCILILKTLPDRSDNWLVVSNHNLVIGGGCYWYAIDGDYSENNYSVRIRIPTEQLLTPITLTNLLERVQTGEWQ